MTRLWTTLALGLAATSPAFAQSAGSDSDKNTNSNHDTSNQAGPTETNTNSSGTTPQGDVNDRTGTDVNNPSDATAPTNEHVPTTTNPTTTTNTTTNYPQTTTTAPATTDTTGYVSASTRDTTYVRTSERDGLWRAQTPQGFPRDVIVRAHRDATAERISATDDAGLCERLGIPVVIVRGSERAMKITEDADFERAEALFRLSE